MKQIPRRRNMILYFTPFDARPPPFLLITSVNTMRFVRYVRLSLVKSIDGKMLPNMLTFLNEKPWRHRGERIAGMLMTVKVFYTHTHTQTHTIFAPGSVFCNTNKCLLLITSCTLCMIFQMYFAVSCALKTN